MVSWGTSFYKGFVIFLWCTMWGIVGGVITIVLGVGSLWMNLSQPNFWQALLRNPQYMWTILTESLIGFLIGGFIAFVGQFASFFKVAVDGATGEVKKLKNELEELRGDMTREIAEGPVNIDEVSRDLEKKIQEVRDETTEEITKTREMLKQLSSRNEEERAMSEISDERLPKLQIDIAKEIGNRIVREVD